MRKLFEVLGVGILLHVPLLILIVIYNWVIVPIDGLPAPLVEYFFGRPLPLVGFLMVMIYFAVVGAFVSSGFGNKIAKFLFGRFFIFSLFLHGARIGNVKRMLKSRRSQASIIMAPYYRRKSLWPFIILRIFETSVPDEPLVVGVFFDFPIPVFKPMALGYDDEILAGLTFDEAVAFSTTAGIGIDNFSVPLRKVKLSDYIKEAGFVKFFYNGA